MLIIFVSIVSGRVVSLPTQENHLLLVLQMCVGGRVYQLLKLCDILCLNHTPREAHAIAVTLHVEEHVTPNQVLLREDRGASLLVEMAHCLGGRLNLRTLPVEEGYLLLHGAMLRQLEVLVVEDAEEEDGYRVNYEVHLLEHHHLHAHLLLVARVFNGIFAVDVVYEVAENKGGANHDQPSLLIAEDAAVIA